MNRSIPLKYQELSISERIKLVEDIWDSIALDQGALPLTPSQKNELQKRLDAYFETGNPGELAKQAIGDIRNKL